MLGRDLPTTGLSVRYYKDLHSTQDQNKTEGRFLGKIIILGPPTPSTVFLVFPALVCCWLGTSPVNLSTLLDNLNTVNSSDVFLLDSLYFRLS